MPAQEYKRTLVTIMSIDAVTYTRLMGLNEERAVENLAIRRNIISERVEEFNGRTFGVAGDSLMAEFASPVDAVRSALAFQRDIYEINCPLEQDHGMQFRVGINIGDVINREGDLFGDDVNIAARVQSRAPCGGIAITGTVNSHTTGKLPVTFTDTGLHKLKNVSVDIPIFQTSIGEDEGGSVPIPLELADNATSILPVENEIPGFHNRPALAVLPFEVRGGDKDFEYIADGLAEDLITGLSRMRWFPIISRNSSFVFRGKPVDEKTIGRTLGARYLVQGSFRILGEQLRVCAQLVDAYEGTNIWSDEYNFDMEDIFSLLDNITQNIIGSLSAQIDRAEQYRSYAKPIGNLDTWDLVRRGMWHQHKLTKEDAFQARGFFEKALEYDPNSVDALVQMSWWHWWHVWTQMGDKQHLLEMEELARWAMHMDHMDARPHMLLGIAQLMQKKPEHARGMLKDAVRRDPSLSIAHASIGTTHLLCWEGEKALQPLLTAMRLNPADMNRFHTLGELALAYHIEGDWEQAISHANRSLDERPGYWYVRVILIGSLIRSNKRTEAQHELEALSKRNPKFDFEHLSWLPFADPGSNRHLIDGLKLAGFQSP